MWSLQSTLVIVFMLCFIILCIFLNLPIKLFAIEQGYAQVTRKGKQETNTEIKYIHELYNICRERTSKWFISVEDYLYEYVPQYLAGGSVIMFANVAKLHRETFPYVRYIFIDDSYIGIVAYVWRLVPSNDDRIYIDYAVVEPERLQFISSSLSYGHHTLLRGVLYTWFAAN
jgi:hypothetical protein